MAVNMAAPEVVAIGSLEALRVLVDGQRHRIVTLLMHEPMTARDLAGRLGIGRTRLYYHLDLLQQHGIIRVVGTRLVSGIEERTYRAVARGFRVDRTLLAPHASEPQIADAQASILESVASDLRARALSGEPHSERDDSEVLVARTFLRLNDERRSELRARLAALIEHYRDADEDGRDAELGLALFTTEREKR